MKIGKFAETNRLSIDTIRHYMDFGLIVPEKKGGQYDFDSRCQMNLENILELKGMGFSLNEIKMIFFYKNFGRLTDYEADHYYKMIYLDKFKKLEEEIKDLVNSREKLKQKLDQLKTKKSGPDSVMGVDLKVLDLLRCTKCSSPLTLQDGSISRNQVMEGKLECECGHSYTISSGVLMAEGALEHAAGMPEDSHITEYILETDQSYLENLHLGLEWSKRKMEKLKLDNKILLELGSGVGFFLRNILEDLPENCLYIAVDRSFPRHLYLKGLLERSGLKRNILFICSDFLNLPLKDGISDVLIDHAGTSNYSFEHTSFLLKDIDHLIKNDAYLMASYLVFKNFSHKSKIKEAFRGNFMTEKVKEKVKELGYTMLDERKSGLVDKGGRFENFFVEGEEIFSYAIFGKR